MITLYIHYNIHSPETVRFCLIDQFFTLFSFDVLIKVKPQDCVKHALPKAYFFSSWVDSWHLGGACFFFNRMVTKCHFCWLYSMCIWKHNDLIWRAHSSTIRTHSRTEDALKAQWAHQRQKSDAPTNQRPVGCFLFSVPHQTSSSSSAPRLTTLVVPLECQITSGG